MRAARALAWREVVRFLRQPSRIVGAFAPPLLAWLLIGSGFSASFRVPGGGGASYATYFFPGTIVLVVLFAAIFSTISVIEDRREGFLQAVVVSSASPFSVALGKIAGGTLLALAQGGALLLRDGRPARSGPAGYRAMTAVATSAAPSAKADVTATERAGDGRPDAEGSSARRSEATP